MSRLTNFFKRFAAESRKGQGFRLLLGLVVVAAFAYHEFSKVGFPLIERLDLLTYDMRLRATMPGTLDQRVVIVDIDEKSIAAEGRFPWNRKKMAELVTRLFDDYGIKILGFDILFAERDESSGLKQLEELSRRELADDTAFKEILAGMRPSLDYDAQFARALHKYPVVLGYNFTDIEEKEKRISTGVLPQPWLTRETFQGIDIKLDKVTAYQSNLAIFQQPGVEAGHIRPSIDVDGVIRRVPLLTEYQGGLYEALSLSIAKMYLEGKVMKTTPSSSGANGEEVYFESIEIDQTHIPLDDFASVLVPYRGNAYSFKYVSATDVLHGKADKKDLLGKIALVGTSASGLLDLRSTPVSQEYPGVEVHANLVSGIIEQRIKSKSFAMNRLQAVVLLLLAGIMVFLLPRMGPGKATLILVLILSAILAFNLFMWKRQLVLPLTAPVLLFTSLFIFNMAHGFFASERAKRAIVSRFGEYVPKELVGEMAKNPEDYSMKGENREMTVLFSDVRDFTSISEGLSADQLKDMMNYYLTSMTEVIQKERGTIDKYIGDAIMAFWGAPLADPDHPRHALLAAMSMQKVIAALAPEFQKRGWPPLHIGVGLNNGRMNVGDMGSQFRRAYTVMGDAVNLASRLEGLTKEYGVGILVSENIVKAAPIAVYREIDRVTVKGRQEPTTIYEPLGLIGEVVDQVIDATERFHKALQLYRAQQWDDAERLIRALQFSAPETKLYGIFLERIAHCRANPPGVDWDGVFAFTTK